MGYDLRIINCSIENKVKIEDCLQLHETPNINLWRVDLNCHNFEYYIERIKFVHIKNRILKKFPELIIPDLKEELCIIDMINYKNNL